MIPTLSNAFAEVAALWRRDRAVLGPIAGMFFFLPLLAQLLLLPFPKPVPDATSQQAGELMLGFYNANLGWLLLVSLWVTLGMALLLNWYLDPARPDVAGAGRSMIARLPAYLAITVMINLAWALSFLLVVPFVYLVGRLYLIGAQVMARRDQTLFQAFSSGIAATRQSSWRIALMVIMLAFGYLGLSMIADTIDAGFALSGFDPAYAGIPGALLQAAAGAAWSLGGALLQVVLYRALAPSRQGI